MDTNLNRAAGLLTIRLILGFIFFMQGFGKVYTWGMDVVHKEFFYIAYKGILPDFLIAFAAYYTSYVELIGGALLIIGFKRNYTLYALASVLVIVTFGHGLTDPIWDLSHVMYRTILLIALLLLPEAWDRFSLDGMLLKNKKN